MSKKKIMIIVAASFTLIALLAFAVPVFAAASGASAQPERTTPANRPRVLLRLLLVQDEAKVDALIARAVEAGKLTPEQAVKVKDFWADHHARFTRNVILARLLRAQDESKVQAFLDRAVTAGKVQPAQTDKIIQIWEILHTPVPAGAGN